MRAERSTAASKCCLNSFLYHPSQGANSSRMQNTRLHLNHEVSSAPRLVSQGNTASGKIPGTVRLAGREQPGLAGLIGRPAASVPSSQRAAHVSPVTWGYFSGGRAPPTDFSSLQSRKRKRIKSPSIRSFWVGRRVRLQWAKAANIPIPAANRTPSARFPSPSKTAVSPLCTQRKASTEPNASDYDTRP